MRLNYCDELIMNHKDIEPNQNIHELGVNYVKDLLDRVGFTIHEVNKDPNHHFQICTPKDGLQQLERSKDF